MRVAPGPGPAGAGPADRTLVIRELRKEYRPGQPVLRGIDLTIAGQGITAIIGPSGAGKSTLVRCINRLVDPTSGAILFQGRDLARLTGRELREARRRLGMVFQEFNLVERLTVMENLLCGRLGYTAVALLFVAVFGPGALAGTFAVGFRSIGFIGKLLSEALEEAQRGPIEALLAAGAPRAGVLRMGYWPQVKPAFWSIVLLRWDINVRESAVLGLVGAGGIGMALDAALNRFFWDRVATILVTIFLVVVLAEIGVTMIRR